MKQKIKYIFIILSLLFCFIFISISSYASSVSQNLSDNFFRLHILANSDSEIDQELKLKVRDAILEYMDSQDFSKTSKLETMNSVKNNLEIYLCLDKVLPYQIYCILKDRFMKYLKCSIEIQIESKDPKCNEKELMNYILEIMSNHHYSFHIELKDGKIKLDRDKQSEYEHIQECLRNFGIMVEFIESETQVFEEVKTVKGPKRTNEVKEVIQEKKPFTPKKQRTYLPLELKDIHEACENVEIWGDVFEIETRPVGKSILQSVYLADNDDAIVMKRFTGARLSEEEMNQLKVGQRIKAYGRVADDSFIRSLVFMPDRIEVIEKTSREDNAEEKRVELHVHTKLSEMDGVSSISQYIDQAIKWNHKAIAITDHLVVQDFPKAQRYLERVNKGRENPIKMLYGVEMNMVDPELNIVRNPNDTKLEKARYCIFDLETTGISHITEKITEIGIIKIKNGEIIDTFETFVNPEKPIPQEVVEVTHITDDMVKDAETIDKVIPKIIDFIGDSVLVAHNADFDMSFIKKNCENDEDNIADVVNETVDETIILVETIIVGEVPESYYMRA